MTANKAWLLIAALCFAFGLAYWLQRSEFRGGGGGSSSNVRPFRVRGSSNSGEPAGILPQELFRLNIYTNRDFSGSEKHRAPPFWDCHGSDQQTPCNRSDVWGPCYAPRRRVDWNREVEGAVDSGHMARYHDAMERSRADPQDLSDYCLPGFLIIGAGKCGTSSLYHYLTSHPRVLPAQEKQIHYFKYYYDNPMQWYLRHFPTATSFLANGALLTGEASPGYLPYPDVVHRVRTRMPGPRIVAIARNPLERAYSSYRYNYVTPTLAELRRGKVPHVRGGGNDTAYESHLFSFEDLVAAELRHLRKCLDPETGDAVVKARDAWNIYGWARDEMARREQARLPPLVDLDGHCYGEGSKTAPREQWNELMAKYPDKVMTTSNLHLKQALIGRSLYFAPLEWWYAGMPQQDIYLMCTEELQDFSGRPMRNLTRFLGLPDYNLSAVLQEGAFNVGGHRGYDKEISWQEISEEEVQDTIPLSDDLRRELLEFIRPYNERLFGLVGHRCNWD